MRKQSGKKSSASTNFSLVGIESDVNFGFTTGLLKKKKPERKNSASKGVRSSLISPQNSLKKIKNKENFYQTVFNTQKVSPVSTPLEMELRKKRTREDYRFIHQVGSGGFGHVWKVQSKKDNSVLAMK